MPKISELNVASNTSTSDLIVVVKDVNGAPSTNKMTVGNFMTYASRMGAYASNTEPGVIKVGDNLTINATGFLNAQASVGSSNTGNIIFTDTIITTVGNNSNITIDPKGTGELVLKNAVFEHFETSASAIIFRDANTAGRYNGIGNSSIYLDLANIQNDGGDFVIKGDGRFKYYINNGVAVQNTAFGHIVLRTENNDKFIRVNNVTDTIGIEIRTDEHSIQLGPNNYVWDFSPQGFLNVPDGAKIKFSDNTIITSITGPYTDDSNANAAGVALKSLYYDSSGNVKIRLT